MNVSAAGSRQAEGGQDMTFGVFGTAPWERLLAAHRQWPDLSRRSVALSRRLAHECFRHGLAGQQHFTELSCACLTGVTDVLAACRDARSNGGAPEEIWNRCLEAAQKLLGAELSFVEGRVKSLDQLLAAAAAASPVAAPPRPAASLRADTASPAAAG